MPVGTVHKWGQCPVACGDYSSRKQAAGHTDRRELERALRARLADWRGLLTRHVAQGRKVLQTLLLERLVFTPKTDDAGERYYEFTARGSLEPLLDGVVRAKVCVSPTGFEPVFPD